MCEWVEASKQNAHDDNSIYSYFFNGRYKYNAMLIENMCSGNLILRDN